MKIDLIHRYYKLPGAITPIVNASLKEYEKEKIKVNLIFEDKLSHSTLFGALKFYLQTIKKINKSNSDLVITHSFPMLYFKYFIHKPVILVVHNTGNEEYEFTNKSILDKMSKFFRIRSFKSADKLFVVSLMVKNVLIKNYHIPKSKIVVIHNGLDYCLFKPFSNNNIKYAKKFVILHRGTDERKGFDLLLKWAPCLIKNIKNVYFLILGNKVNLNKELTSYFEFIEWVDYKKMPETYALSNIVICPSKYDPFPGVVLEAMACQKPVIMSNKCGNKELVLNYKNGVVANFDDFPKIIIKLSKDKQLCYRLGKSARKTIIDDLDWNKIIKKQIIEFNKFLKPK